MSKRKVVDLREGDKLIDTDGVKFTVLDTRLSSDGKIELLLSNLYLLSRRTYDSSEFVEVL